MLGKIRLFLLIALMSLGQAQQLNTEYFPPNFFFGIATSAYQSEGAWNKDGKGLNSWDDFTHTQPEKIKDGKNGDIACNSYYKYKEDVALLKNLGVQYYRFSLSWSRILPDGLPHKINKAGIDYYNNLINELLSKSIKPMVTLYHWDLPLQFQNFGGFTNRSIIDWFEGFARVAFDNFGDRVKIWTTFNEPKQICLYGYGQGMLSPGYEESGILDYLCTHNLLLAHARVYNTYVREYRNKQKGRIGIVIECPWYFPATSTLEDVKAAKRQNEFDCGLYSNPIFSNSGDYPQIVKDLVAKRSYAEGYPTSRLPAFTKQEIIDLRGSYDYFGLNHYSSYVVKNYPTPVGGKPSQEKDAQVSITQPSEWPGIEPFKNVPWGFRKILQWIKNAYNNPNIIVTENGYPDPSPIHDKDRINYHTWYLSNLLDAVYYDNVKIEGYISWSLMDDFEWNSGYTIGFGFYDVDFTDPNRTRTPKDSVAFYSNIIKNRKLV